LEALLLDRWVAMHAEHRLEQREEESRKAKARRRRKRAERRIAVTQYPSPRKAGFQMLIRLSWAGFHPQGSCKRFQLASCGLSSSSKLLGIMKIEVSNNERTDTCGGSHQ
jgi:hypothetical protein